MRISFELDSEDVYLSIKRKAKKLHCRIAGRIFIDYKHPPLENFYDSLMLKMLIPDYKRTLKPIKECTRCGEILYQKRKHQKPRIVTFKRYSEFNKSPGGKND